MYYYIFEPPQGPKEYERTAQIKGLLGQLGIAGEMSAPQPGRTAEDLVAMAIAKRYSTIVVVGGVELMNRVARAVVSHDVVLGLIPTSEHPDIARLIGTNDWKVAAEQLKRRRWHNVQLGLMNNTISFLTPAELTIPAKQQVELQSKEYSARLSGPTKVTIIPQGPEGGGFRVLFEPVGTPKGGLLRLFRGGSAAPQNSSFELEALTITASQAQPVLVAGATLATTPLTCTTEGKPLRLIIGRSNQPLTLSSESDTV